MTEKKEIKVKKSVLNLILKSVALTILTILVVQHFGKITTDDFASNPKIYLFENPINGDVLNTDVKLLEYPTYFEKVEHFYIPSLFGNPIHILIGTILFAGIFGFFGNYKLKLS